MKFKKQNSEEYEGYNIQGQHIKLWWKSLQNSAQEKKGHKPLEKSVGVMHPQKDFKLVVFN